MLTLLLILLHAVAVSVSGPFSNVVEAIAKTAALSSFNDLIRKSGMIEELEKIPDPGARKQKGFFVMAPSNHALRSMNQTYLDLISSSQDTLQSALEAIILPKPLRQVGKHQLVHTLSEEYVLLNNFSIKKGPWVVTANCIKVPIEEGVHTHNGVVHVLHRFMMPFGSVHLTDILAESYKLFYKVIDFARFNMTSNAHEQWTVFAPTDNALLQLDDVTFQQLFTNRSFAAELVKVHITNTSMVCSSGFPFEPVLMSLSSTMIELISNGTCTIVNNKSCVTRTDQLARNGVVHGIDQTLSMTD